MATTQAQTFYCSISTADQTLTGASTIRSLLTTGPATTTTTTLTYSSTTASSETVIPQTATSTASDTSSNNGWVFNTLAASSDALNSTASAQRVIPAGVWTFNASITTVAPALTTTGSFTITVNVYRVATGGGARTLLFSTAFSASTWTAAQTNNISTSSTSQPRYLLGAGEVIMVGYTINSAATILVAGVGSATNSVLTFVLGSTGATVAVPSPGIRTQNNRTLVATSINTAKIVKRLVKKAITLASTNTAIIIKKLTLRRFLSATSTNTAVIKKRNILARKLVASSTNTVMTFVTLAIRNIPSGSGGTTIINKIFSTFD